MLSSGGYIIVDDFVTWAELTSLDNGDDITITDDQIAKWREWAFSGKPLMYQYIDSVKKGVYILPMYVSGPLLRGTALAGFVANIAKYKTDRVADQSTIHFCVDFTTHEIYSI